MSISHDANEILVSGTETGESVRAYMTTNSLGTVYDRTAILDRNINVDTNASFTDHDCTWIFPSTYHWDFNKWPIPTLFELEDAVIVYTGDAKNFISGAYSGGQPRADTIRLTNVQYRIEGNIGRTDFFGGTSGFEFTNVQLISYGSGLNYLHLNTEGGLMEDVAVRVGAGGLAFQPSSSNNNTLTLRNWTLDPSLGLIQGNGGTNNLTAVTRLENLVWERTEWHIGTGTRGQHYKVINPIKPTGWQSYKGSTDTTKCRCDEYHTHNVRIVDEDNNALSGFAVHLRRSDGTVVYELTTDSNGDIAEQEVMTYEQTGQTGAGGGVDFTQYNGFSLAGVSYSNKLVSGIKNLADGRIDEVIGSFTDTTIAQSAKTIVDGYTEINTPEKFYDRAKAHLVDNFAGETSTIVSREGSTVNIGSYDLDVDPDATQVFAFNESKITIKASTFVGNITTTGGTISLLGDAQIVGSYGDISVLPFTITNVEAGSTVQLYNVTDDNEISNAVVSGTAGTKVTYSGTYANSLADANDEVRLRITCQSGETALLPYESFGVATSAGISFKANQVEDTVYNNNAIDGSSSSFDNSTLEIDADYSNFQLDVSDTDNPGVVTTQQIYAKYAYLVTTSEGIEKFFGAITAENGSNYRINTSVVDLKIQNISSSDMIISGARLYRDDSTTVIVKGPAGAGTLSHDTGEFLQYIQPQVTAAMNEYGVAGPDDLNPIKKNTNLIPGLL